MRSKHAAKLFISVFFVALSMGSRAEQAFVAGPIEAISSAGTIRVLGQTLSFDKRTPLTVDGKSTFLSKAANLLPAGSFVLIEVSEKSAGSVALKATASLKSQYVPGSTSVAIAGTIKSVSSTDGTVRIGDVVVDISSIAPEMSSQLQPGAFVSIEGIQPVRGGAIVSLTGFSIGGSGAQSIGGSGTSSIGGSGASSIGGSGVSSIGGSGVSSIGGSGLSSIGGSGTLSIGGSGTLSIGGSGTKSIGGSGKASIGGSGVQSIGGSGVLSIGGSGL